MINGVEFSVDEREALECGGLEIPLANSECEPLGS
jgi:hypothetical protein